MLCKSKLFFFAPVALVYLTSCAKDPLVDASNAKALYVAGGMCYSGNGITTFNATTSSNLIYKVDLSRVTGDSSVVKHNISDKIHY